MSIAASPERQTQTPTKSDTAAIVGFVIIGAILTIVTVVGAVRRIIELLGPGPFAVPARFIDTPALAPIGPTGQQLEVTLDSAIVSAPALPSASIGAGVIGQILLIAAALAVFATIALLCRNLVRGRIFSASSTVYAAIAGISGLVGAAAVPFFDNMVANGAIAWVSERSFGNSVVLAVQPLPFMVAAFTVALVLTVFGIGARLQRETEGLV